MRVFAYRVFDLRDRFPQPFSSALQALESLFGENAYLADDSGEIIAYYPDGTHRAIPRSLFTITCPRFKTEIEAQAWVTNQMSETQKNGDNNLSFGTSIANSADSLENQIKDAMTCEQVELNREIPLQDIARSIEHWLDNNH